MNQASSGWTRPEKFKILISNWTVGRVQASFKKRGKPQVKTRMEKDGRYSDLASAVFIEAVDAEVAKAFKEKLEDERLIKMNIVGFMVSAKVFRELRPDRDLLKIVGTTERAKGIVMKAEVKTVTREIAKQFERALRDATPRS